MKDVFLKRGTYTSNRSFIDKSLKQFVEDFLASGEVTITLGGLAGFTGTLAQFNAALTGADFATLAGTETLTNKTLTSPTIATPAVTAGTFSKPALANPKITGMLVKNPGAAVTGTADATLSAANMIAGKVFQLTGGSGRTFTTDTGANITTAFTAAYGAPAVGDQFTFTVSNASTGSVTMAGALGATLGNAMTVTTLQSRTFIVENTGANAWTIY